MGFGTDLGFWCIGLAGALAQTLAQILTEYIVILFMFLFSYVPALITNDSSNFCFFQVRINHFVSSKRLRLRGPTELAWQKNRTEF